VDTQNVFDFSTSNLILTVGGQILILVFLLMLVFFGTAPLSFPANAVKEMINKNSGKN
jgi:hypothetical protein